jgi:hypothetical protein
MAVDRHVQGAGVALERLVFAYSPDCHEAGSRSRRVEVPFGPNRELDVGVEVIARSGLHNSIRMNLSGGSI